MVLHESLKTQSGKLIRLKTGLVWKTPRRWDRKTGRICLLVDAVKPSTESSRRCSATSDDGLSGDLAAALLMFDNDLHWVWLSQYCVEVIDGTR